MRYYFRVLMLTLAVWQLNAASSWAQDYVILPSGEQLEGRIARKFDYNQYSKLRFIEHTGVQREFSPDQIQGFGLQNGRVFQVKQFEGMDQPVFVQRVFTGKINLIQYDGRFFLENDHQTLELKEQFTRKEIEGRYYSAHEKPYIGVLNIMMAGKCGTELNYFINFVRLVEESLIGILKKYHECEELDYEIQVLQIPLLRVSPLVRVGMANSTLVPHSRTDGRRDVLGNTFFPQVQASMRLHSFRNAPRTTLEIGVGYQLEKTTLFAELQEPGLLITGEENVRATSLTVPVSYQYTFYGRPRQDFYFGGGGTFWSGWFETEQVVVDRNQARNTYLHEEGFYGRRKMQLVPQLILGTNIYSTFSQKIVAEVRGEWYSNHYRTRLLYNKANYSHLQTTFLVGYQF